MLFCQGKPAGWIWASSLILFALVATLSVIQMRLRFWVRAYEYQDFVAAENAATHASISKPKTHPASLNERNTHDLNTSDGVDSLKKEKGCASQTNSIYTERERKQLCTPRSTLELIAVDLPFSIYFGWVTVASILNVTLGLVASGFDKRRVKRDHAQWAVAVLGIAAGIFATMVLKEGNWAYGFVYPWAILAIRDELKNRQCTLHSKVTAERARSNAAASQCEMLQNACLAFAITRSKIQN